MAKQRNTDNVPAVNPVAVFAAQFWLLVETKGSMDGVPIGERPYYGLRPSDYITVELKSGPTRVGITSLWRTMARKRNIDTDLVIASSYAVQAGLLKQGSIPGRKLADGTRGASSRCFFTPNNPVFTSKAKVTKPGLATTAAELEAFIS